ncbi:hypothetical protein G7Y89_g9850 [Cudoniella acicularis]|uniref:Uncharacterized protein n=1 Tax=Cudoniella acicularis TaxID=354080 RepID=A0A8H4W266_9HELO|nr:hypothetical protein G7Y89_g9850 [Cudoniella acicularis]
MLAGAYIAENSVDGVMDDLIELVGTADVSNIVVYYANSPDPSTATDKAAILTRLGQITSNVPAGSSNIVPDVQPYPFDYSDYNFIAEVADPGVVLRG